MSAHFPYIVTRMYICVSRKKVGSVASPSIINRGVGLRTGRCNNASRGSVASIVYHGRASLLWLTPKNMLNNHYSLTQIVKIKLVFVKHHIPYFLLLLFSELGWSSPGASAFSPPELCSCLVTSLLMLPDLSFLSRKRCFWRIQVFQCVGGRGKTLDALHVVPRRNTLFACCWLLTMFLYSLLIA